MMLIGLLILLSGCAGSGAATRLEVCGPWQPIYVSKADVLTEGTARQILAHNEVGRALKCW